MHDAANILRRYLNNLPEPIVPLDCYERFRDPLRAYQAKAGSDAQGQNVESEEHAKAVVAYQRLITELPPLNRQLLLYILDLLAVFASKSDMNRMTAQNLAAIFQPGIISHPHHDMAPNEYRLSQDVLIFLIENQDNFLIGMTGTAMDQKTKDEVKSGPPSIKTPKSAIGRSASTASAGADSLRRTGGVHPNGSRSSHHSRDRTSPQVSSPGTPVSPSALGGSANTTGGLTRSNTVPSNRSPAMSGQRFQRMSEAAQSTTPMVGQAAPIADPPPDPNAPVGSVPIVSALPGTDIRLPSIQSSQAPEPPQPADPVMNESQQTADSVAAAPTTGQDSRLPQDSNVTNNTNNKPQTKDRKISDYLTPKFGSSDALRDPNQRQPRKLQKRRIPGSANESAQSSQASLNTEEGNAFQTPLATPNSFTHDRAEHFENQSPSAVTNVAEPSFDRQSELHTASPTTREIRNTSSTLMPPHSPTPSIHSKGSATDPSDLDALDDPAARDDSRRNATRISNQNPGPLAPPPPIGQNPGARTSNSSIGSNRPRKSFTGESQVTQTSSMETSSMGYPSMMHVTSRESADLSKDPYADQERKGFFGRMKAKMQQSREDRHADKERTKSPPRFPPEQPNSRTSLSTFAHEHFSPRGRSFDRPREGSLNVADDKRGHDRTGSKTPVPPTGPWPAGVSQPAPASAPLSAPPQAGVPANQAFPNSTPIGISGETRKSATAPIGTTSLVPDPKMPPGPEVGDSFAARQEVADLPSEAQLPIRASTEAPGQFQTASAHDQTTATMAPVPAQVTSVQADTTFVQVAPTVAQTQQTARLQQEPVDMSSQAPARTQVDNLQQHS